MDTQNNNAPSDIYQFNTQATYQQIYDNVSKRLIQAEALLYIGSQCQLETMNEELIDGYFWALTDIVREAKTLHGKLHSRAGEMR